MDAFNENKTISADKTETSQISKEKVIIIGFICTVCVAVVIFTLVLIGMRRINRLEAQLHSSQQLVSELTTSLEERTAELEQTRASLEQANVMIAEEQGKNEELKSQLAAVDAELKNKNNALASTKRTIAKIKKNCELKMTKTMPEEAILAEGTLRNTYQAVLDQYIDHGNGNDGSSTEEVNTIMESAGLMDENGELLRVKEEYVKKGAALIANFDLKELVSMELYIKTGQGWMLAQKIDLKKNNAYLGNRALPAYLERVQPDQEEGEEKEPQTDSNK